MSKEKLVIEMYKTNVGNFFKIKGLSSYMLGTYLVNNIKISEFTAINGFFRIQEDIREVKKITVKQNKISHFVLKNPKIASDNLPLEIADWKVDDEGYYEILGSADIAELYMPVVVEQEPIIETVEFEVNLLGEFIIEDPANIKDRKIKTVREGNWKEEEIEVALAQVVEYDDVIKLLTPEFLLAQVPCKLSSKQMYKIVRQHLIKNLDQTENTITSNYDFCFTVKKRAHTKPFISSESYFSGRKLKTKNVTKNEKLVEVFEMTWAGYKGKGGYEGYTCIQEMQGNNLEDLYTKLTNYLDYLVGTLNKRVEECSCCNGTGFIIDRAKNPQ